MFSEEKSMVRYSITISLIVSGVFSYSIKQTININVHRSVAIGIIGVSDTKITDFGLGMSIPLSHHVGLQAGLCGLGSSSNDVYRPTIAGEIGFIEMLLTKYISPYSTQCIQSGFFRKGAESNANCFLTINIGIEFLSNYLMNLFIEGGTVVGVEHWTIRGGGGVRLSF